MGNIKTLQKQRNANERIAVLTAYDASMAALQVKAGVDVILVGDSLGMVVQGHRDTVPVQIESMVYHTANVRRGAPDAFIIADMPFMTTVDEKEALKAAQSLMQQGGADMVKVEGSTPTTLSIIERLSGAGVPVCAHLGLLPQQIRAQGNYAQQGKTAEQALHMRTESNALRRLGVAMIVLEGIPADLAEQLTQDWEQSNGITIGIGAGAACHGQVLVSYDILGISPHIPSFSHNFLASTNGIEAAFEAYVKAVKQGTFPSIS